MKVVTNAGKRVRLTKKTRPGELSHDVPDPRASNAEEMEKIASPPLPPKEKGSEVGVPRKLFPRLGVE